MKNYTRADIEKLLNGIINIINYFEEAQIENREYTIFLASGDRIKYSIPKKSIAHLLGVNTSYLIGTNIFQSKDSYGMLREMCENEYYFWNNISKGIIDPNKVFSKYTDIKIKSFSENIKINVYKTEFVCVYNKERTYGLENSEENYDYIICEKCIGDKYMILGLVKNGIYTVPMSNQFFDDFESAKEAIKNLIYNQNITFINHILISNNEYDYEDKIYVTEDIKFKKLSRLFYYKNEFNSTIDVCGEYKFILNKLQANKENMQDNYQIAELISECILKGKIINENDININNFNVLPDYLKNIINSFNDYLTSGNDNDCKETYSSKIKELTDAKKLIQELTNKVSELEQNNNDLSIDNNNLRKENELLNNNNQKTIEYTEKIIQLIKK